MWPVNATGPRCKWGAGVLNWDTAILSHTGHWKSNMVHYGKKFSEGLKKRIVPLHKDGLGWKNFANTLKLSCSTVVNTIQQFNRAGSTQNKPFHGRPKKLSAIAQCHIQSLSFENRCMNAWGVSLLVLRPYATHCITWLLSQKEASCEDNAKESPQTVCCRQAD